MLPRVVKSHHATALLPLISRLAWRWPEDSSFFKLCPNPHLRNLTSLTSGIKPLPCGGIPQLPLQRRCWKWAGLLAVNCTNLPYSSLEREILKKTFKRKLAHGNDSLSQPYFSEQHPFSFCFPFPKDRCIHRSACFMQLTVWPAASSCQLCPPSGGEANQTQDSLCCHQNKSSTFRQDAELARCSLEIRCWHQDISETTRELGGACRKGF